MRIAKSRTTQNVAASAVATNGTAATLLWLVRENRPEIIPWTAESDAVIVALVTATIVPFVSRALAFARNKEKTW